jgi:hypothetical protein
MKENIDSLLSQNFKDTVNSAVNSGKVINFETHVLGDSGETKLKYIILVILEKCGRPDLMELIYTSAKELIVNSIKAAIKRIILNESTFSHDDPEEYQRIMEEFKESLTDKKFPHFREKMKMNGFKVNVKFYYDEQKIILKIINNFILLDQEEKRIREKFVKAKKYDNLFEFYMENSDNTEGAGMGITLVEILLLQSGFDRHLFTIYSREDQTVAKLELPLKDTYIPARFQFLELLKSSSINNLEELRKKFRK